MVFDTHMQDKRTATNTRRIKATALCLLLSLLTHFLLAVVLILTAGSPQERPTRKNHGKHRTILITRAGQKKERENETQNEQKPFIKTDADRPQQHPDEADFEGQRDARAEGMNNDTRRSDVPAPTMEGEEKEELNTLQQERQDGDIEHYGKEEPQPQPSPQPEQEEPTAEQATPAAPGMPDAPPTPQPDTATSTAPQEQEATETQSPVPDTTEGDQKLQTSEDTPEETEEPSAEPPAPPAGTPNGSGTEPTPDTTAVQVRRPIYDPTQADHAQPPGLRTTERRTRSTGQFVIGRQPSCNVEATPRGQYEELVYRLIARQWYFACDQHRGDIIPGTIIIAIRITKRGQVESMNLVNRRGAGVSQQSFTFAAIRRAQFPPMPQAVAKTLIGDRMEIIITFDFN